MPPYKRSNSIAHDEPASLCSVTQNPFQSDGNSLYFTSNILGKGTSSNKTISSSTSDNTSTSKLGNTLNRRVSGAQTDANLNMVNALDSGSSRYFEGSNVNTSSTSSNSSTTTSNPHSGGNPTGRVRRAILCSNYMKERDKEPLYATTDMINVSSQTFASLLVRTNFA